MRAGLAVAVILALASGCGDSDHEGKVAITVAHGDVAVLCADADCGVQVIYDGDLIVAATAVWDDGKSRSVVRRVASIGRLRIETGTGNDHLLMDDTFQREIGSLVIDTGAGDDFLDLTDSAAASGDASITTGAGDDELLVNPLSFGGTATIAMEAGNDHLTIDGGVVRVALAVDAGDGDDSVTLGPLVNEGTVRIATGAGDDTLALFGVTYDGSFVLDGGAGSDTLDDARSTFTGRLDEVGFEG